MFGISPEEGGSAAAVARPEVWVAVEDEDEDEELLIDFNDNDVSQEVSPTLFILSVQSLTIIAQFRSFKL
jgi:hypothetical protein